MESILKPVSRIVLILLSVGLMIFTGWRSIRVIQLSLPADAKGSAIAALCALEIGLIAWTLILMFGAHGNVQRAISGLMIIVSLIGISVGVIADTFIQESANGITHVDSAVAVFANVILAVIVLANVAAFIFFEVFDPDIRLRAMKRAADYQLKEAELQHIIQIAPQLASETAPYLAAKWKRDRNAELLSGLGMSKAEAQQHLTPKPVLPQNFETGQFYYVPQPTQQNIPAQPVPQQTFSNNQEVTETAENFTTVPLQSNRKNGHSNGTH